MKHILVSTIAFAAVSLLDGVHAQTPVGGLSGSHTDIPRWCGKPYMEGSPNFNPGGMLTAPSPSDQTLLLLQIQPQHSIYDSSEKSAAFLVSAPLTNTLGAPYGNQSYGHHLSDDLNLLDSLNYSIQILNSKGRPLGGVVQVNSTNNIISFDLAPLKPQLTPYTVEIHAYAVKTFQSYSAGTQLYYLPAKNSGSTVKVDNLHGGMLVANSVTNYAFKPLLPFGFYTSCSGFLQTTYSNISYYQSLGFNAINPVCDLVGTPDISYIFDWMDEADLWYQFDMRGAFMNLTQTSEQVALVKDRSNLLHWYSADEPDGWQYALNQTRITYDLLRREDPYHPVALVLNCENYYFEDYASGTDIIMQDAYPISINPTYSSEWHVPCNTTYGDCGCDNCIGSVTDVSSRMDDLHSYQTWLGLAQKPIYAVLQAFSSSDYWSRDPTPAETFVMTLLNFNHRGKGQLSWLFPSSDILNAAHGEIAKVITSPSVAPFILNTHPVPVSLSSSPSLDVAYWSPSPPSSSSSSILLSLANTASSPTGPVSFTIPLPVRVCAVKDQVWGNLTYSVQEGKLVVHGPVEGLGTSLVVLDTLGMEVQRDVQVAARE